MLDLDWLLKPYDKNTFFDEVWQKKPEVLVTGRAGYFESLFSKRSVERIIEFAQPQPPTIRFAFAESDEQVEIPFSPNGRANIDRIRKLYLQGQTVILNSVENFDPTVAQLTRAVETEMGARVQVNSYLTPPSAQGFRPHYDTHDVLVAQIQGEKLWKVYGGDCVCPLNELVDGGPRFRESMQPPKEIHLRSGDLLYLPRGWVHEAVTLQTASLHLTFGIHPPLGKDLLLAALEALIKDHPELREALSVGPLSIETNRVCLETRFAQLVELFATHASATEAAHAIDDQLLRCGRSGGDGHLFEDMENLPSLARDTVIQRRTNVPCRVIKIDDGVGLQFLNGLIKGPVDFEDAMKFVALNTAPFTASELPGLPNDHQLILASSLVADGLCYLCNKI
ncbi:MAG TPA: cupin domain-containing protein [Pyrinomonadaceae bacterium]|nr:cupin domain-containing protein [Pyrinomonadaceae bacterium]